MKYECCYGDQCGWCEHTVSNTFLLSVWYLSAHVRCTCVPMWSMNACVCMCGISVHMCGVTVYMYSLCVHVWCLCAHVWCNSVHAWCLCAYVCTCVGYMCTRVRPEVDVRCLPHSLCHILRQCFTEPRAHRQSGLAG